MILTSESAKLLLSDPRGWSKLSHEGRRLERNKLEVLTLNMMYDRDEVVNNFIAEAKAPPAGHIGKFIKEFTDEINWILRREEEITQLQIDMLRVSTAARHEISPEDSEALVKKYEDYYTFMLAKDEKFVVTEAQVLQAKNNIALFHNGGDYMNELIKPKSYDRNKVTVNLTSGQASTEGMQALDYFPLNLSVLHDGHKITYSKAGQENVYCVRQSTGNFIEGISNYQFTTPIDITNVYPEQKRVDYANILFCKGSLRDTKNIILNDYYLHVAIFVKCVRYHLPNTLKNFNHIFHIVLIDENNYVGIVRLKEATIKACEDKASEDLSRLRKIRSAELYNTFPEFQRNLVYDL